MKMLSGQRYLRAATRLNNVPDRWRPALKTAATSVVLLGGTLLAGHPEVGMLGTLGAFTVLYGPSSPALYRVKLLTWVAVGLVASVAVGALTASSPWIDVVAMTATAAVATFLCVTFKVGPPGAMFFVLVHGVGGLAVVHGTPPGFVIGSVALGAAVAVVGGMSDLLVDPRRTERHAVEAAEGAMGAYEAETDPARFSSQRFLVSAALLRGWSTVTDAGSPPDLSNRLWDVQARYSAAAARVVGAELGFQASPWGSVTEEDDPAQAEPVEHRPGAVPSAGLRDDIDDERIRDTSLGRPSWIPLVRRALRWPSEPLFVVARVTAATLIAACLARIVGVDHPHWAAAFATLVLHQGGTREAQTIRGIQRFGGTLIGLGCFVVLASLHLDGWWLVLTISFLQFFIEMMVVFNYGIAVVAITPLALTIGSRAAPGIAPVTLARERLLDTVIAIGTAFLVLWLTDRRLDVPILRSYARQVVHGIDAVLGDITAGRVETMSARENRRFLYFSLLESAEIARRVGTDGGPRVAPYLDMEASLSHLGYLVLALAWHPDTRRAHDLGAAARGPLDRILAHPVRRVRPAQLILDDVRDLERVVTSWRPPDRRDEPPTPSTDGPTE